MASQFTINRFGFCSMKILGVGWKNIMFLTYDMKNADSSTDTTPELAKNHRQEIKDFLNSHGITMSVGLQSIPYWAVADGMGDGETIISMPKIPFCEYDQTTQTGNLSEFELSIVSSKEASDIRQYPVDMSFKLEYEGVDINNGHVGYGTDDKDIWGDVTFHGFVSPFMHHDQGLANNGVTLYAGNYRSYNGNNLMFPYMYPILCIQGSRWSPISINLLQFTFFDPYYAIGSDIQPNMENFVWTDYISGELIDLGKKNRLDDWLYCENFATNYQFLNNDLFINWNKPAEDIDPNEGWGTDADEITPVGGNGDGPLSNDDVLPELSDASAINSNFFAVYKCSKSTLNAFANYCWSTNVWDLFTKKFYANPSECVMGCLYMPFDVESSGSAHIYLGDVDTGVSAGVVTKHFQRFNCGSVNIGHPRKNYLDNNPYTKYQIYLPFCGIFPLSADEITGKVVTVIYNIDVLTGGCVAHVIAGSTTIGSYSGSMGIQIPTTSSDLSQSILSAMTAAAGVAGGGIGLAVGAGGAGLQANVTPAMIGNTQGIISGTSGAVSSIKPDYKHGGGLSGNSGWLGINVPYLIVTYPNQALPTGQMMLEGYPAFKYMIIGGFNGYAEFESVKLKATKATKSEQEEILTLLKGGVFI